MVQCHKGVTRVLKGCCEGATRLHSLRQDSAAGPGHERAPTMHYGICHAPEVLCSAVSQVMFRVVTVFCDAMRETYTAEKRDERPTVVQESLVCSRMCRWWGLGVGNCALVCICAMGLRMRARTSCDLLTRGMLSDVTAKNIGRLLPVCPGV
jgi:hypothetical protein